MPENSPQESLVILPLPAPPQSALGRQVEFDFEQMADLRTFYEKQYDAEARRREEICRQYPASVTMLGLVLAANYGVLNSFPSGRHLSGITVLVLIAFSIFYCLRGGSRFHMAFSTIYAKAIESTSIEQVYMDKLSIETLDNQSAYSDAMKKTLAVLHEKFRDDSTVNSRANANASSYLKKSMDDLIMAGLIVIITGVICVVSPVFEDDVRANPQTKIGTNTPKAK